MKLNAGKRILMFLHWLCSLLISAALVLMVLKPPFAVKLYEKGRALVTDSQLKIIAIVALAVYAILTIAQLVLIFKRRRRSERGFIVMDSSDSGRVRIAISAIEQMVRQSVTDIEGITDMKIKIEGDEDAVNIAVNATLINGGHVPTITMNMQRAIRQFVEMNCGVAVRSVPICIRSVTDAANAKRGRKKEIPAPASVPAQEPEPVYAESEPAPAPEPVYAAPEPEPAPAYTEPEAEEPIAEPEPAFAPATEYAPETEPVVEEAEEAPAAEDAPTDGAEEAPGFEAEPEAADEPQTGEAPLTDYAFEAAVEAADGAFTEAPGAEDDSAAQAEDEEERSELFVSED